MPQVVILGCHADGDIIRLNTALTSRGLTSLVWFLDASSPQLDIDATPGRFEICRDSGCLTTEHLSSASIIIYRPAVGCWRRPVLAASGTQVERRFTELEWAAILQSVFLDAEQRLPSKLWITTPSAVSIASSKHHMITTADLDGLRPARLRVSTSNLLPPTVSGAYVSKAINEDEHLDHYRTFPTSAFPVELVTESPFRTDSPSLIQERIYSPHELRVYFLLDDLLAIHLTAAAPYTDIRLVPTESFSVSRVDVPHQLADAIRKYCTRHRLSYCVFDFLRESKDQYLLVDVTPSGSWSYFESAFQPFVTDWYADIIARALPSRGEPVGRP